MYKKYLTALLAGIFILQTAPAFAEHSFEHERYEHDYYRGRYAHRLPPGYVALSFRGLELLYDAGMFYRYTPRGYVLVSAPAGAVVPALPPGYTILYTNGAPYYYYGDTYYVATPQGYMVAQPAVAVMNQPVAVQAPAPVPAPPQPVQTVAQPQPPAASPTSATNGDFEIHIPNANGSYTLVTIRQTDKGFIGPQGEFYPDHPTVDQLRAKYAK